ncbi:trypsin-like serine protease [Natronobacterium lacisalsi]|uniref:trypsin-like serine protease n=2 Tax=cellular organisms TaxID=131567 RepID=UPI0012EB53A0|nr:trypsin-like serine protease [Halobiforma lacisalsi]
MTTKDSERVVSVQINNEKRRKKLSEETDVTESVVQYVPDQISVKLEYGIEDSTKTITKQREVPVIIEEESGFAETDMLEGGEISPDYGGSYYRPLPGATQIEVAQVDDPDYDDSDDWGGCTGCIGVYDEDLEEDVYITAAHCFDAGEGRVFGQPTRNFEAGESDKISYSSNPYFGTRMDAATVQLDDVDVTDEMSDGEGDTYSNPVEGYLHHDWIQDNEGEEGLSKLGIATGHVAGTISNVSASNDYFTTTADRDEGDSGGPHYHIDGDDPYPFYLAGLHRGATVTGNARGILFTSIMDEFNITFGDQYDD